MSKYTKFWAMNNGWSETDAGAFARYMRTINKIMLDEIGLHIDDLPDYDYATAFYSDVREHEVVDDVLEREGFR